jgi:hypothetical protein
MCIRSKIRVLRPRNTEFRSVFAANCHFLINPKVSLWILSGNWNILKTHKNLYMRTLCEIDPEFEIYVQEIRSFDQFLPQTGVFGKTEGPFGF